MARVLDAAPMREEMREFLAPRGRLHADADAVDAAARHTVAGLGDPPSMRTVYRLGDRAPDRMTEAREKVIAVLEDFGDAAFTLGELAEMAGVSTGVVKGLVAARRGPRGGAPRDVPYPPLSPRPCRGGPHARAGDGVRGPDRGGGARALTGRRCSRASRAPARPRSISRPWRSACGRGGRRWCSCPRSR